MAAVAELEIQSMNIWFIQGLYQPGQVQQGFSGTIDLDLTIIVKFCLAENNDSLSFKTPIDICE